MKIYILIVENTERHEYLKKHYDNFEKHDEYIIEFVLFPPGTKLELSLLQTQGYLDYDVNISYKIYNYAKKELHYGTFGCAYAHTYLYNKMIEENIEECMIMEDNMILNAGYFDELNDLFKKLKQNNIKYDIIHLHSWHKNKRETILDDIFVGNNECGGAKFYYLNKKVAKVLLASTKPIRDAADGPTAIPSRHPHYNLKSIVYFFQKTTMINVKSIRNSVDGTIDQNKVKHNSSDIDSIDDIKFIKFIMHDNKEILYKTREDVNVCRRLLNKLKEYVYYGLYPVHYDYNLYEIQNDNSKLFEYFNSQIVKYKIDDIKLIDKNSNIEDTYKECYNSTTSIFVRDDLFNIIKRLQRNFHTHQFIKTMIKSRNFTLGGICINNEDKQYFNMNLKFGEIYVYNTGCYHSKDLEELKSIFFYCSFNDVSDNSDKLGYLKIGEIVYDDITKNMTNEELIAYYSNSVIKDVVFI